MNAALCLCDLQVREMNGVYVNDENILLTKPLDVCVNRVLSVLCSITASFCCLKEKRCVHKKTVDIVSLFFIDRFSFSVL